MPINKPTKHVFKAENGQWGWHVKASNGEIVSTAGEQFVSKAGAEIAFKTMVRNVLVLASEIIRPDTNGSD